MLASTRKLPLPTPLCKTWPKVNSFKMNSKRKFRDPLISEFITLCQKIEEPVPPTETVVEIYPMPHRLTRNFRNLMFLPDRYQSQNDLDFGQLPSKEITKTSIPQRTNHNDGQSILLSLAIVLCLAGLLYILIYFTS